MRHTVAAAVVLALAAAVCLPADPPPLTRSLEEFGPTDKPQAAQATYAKAVEALRKTGGVLVVPQSVWPQVKHLPLQGLVRTPDAPAQTKGWKDGPGVTVVTSSPRQTVVQVPPIAGLRLERPLRLGDGDSLPHWGTHPAITLDSEITYGSSSYLDWLQEPVEKGPDRRFYLPTVRGIHPGQFLNIHGGPGYGGGVTRACVKSLGYDAGKRMHYLVADTDIDHTAGAILHNKSNTGLLHMLQTSHNDNQTYDVKVIRNQFAHGDTYIYYCDFNYMSNVHSAAGDENGNCYAAFVRSMDNNFRGAVESVDWQAAKLRFAAANARNVNTLGDSRPLVNRNPKKAVTAGKVYVVPPEHHHEVTDAGKYAFEGKHYPNVIGKNPKIGTTELKMGGLIRGDKDCPWTADVVGRFFALTTPEEITPKGNLRWYEISAFRENADGTKEIEIKRYWWGAKSAGSPLLYRRDNYTWDGHLRPLDYAIAPGTYVNDVSRAVPGGDRGGDRTLGLAPYRDQNTPLDFEKGDAVEQAIGPDPFKPTVFRSWLWEDVPGSYPAPIFDVANNGAASRHSVLTVAGGGAASMEKVLERREQRPPWDNVIVLNTAVGVGLNCKADFADAAILFQQPYREQPVKWYYGHREGAAPKEATLTVPKDTGELTFAGNGVRTNGPVTGATGLSAGPVAAKNLRGKNVPVEKGATSVRVKFPQAEADGDYAVFVEQSWLGGRAIGEKTADGFTVTFAAGVPDKATIDWMLVR